MGLFRHILVFIVPDTGWIPGQARNDRRRGLVINREGEVMYVDYVGKLYGEVFGFLSAQG